MAKMKYNKAFRSGVIVVAICLLVSLLTLAYSIAVGVRYRNLTRQMETTSATVTKVVTENIRRGGHKQKIQVSYTVEGKAYERKLESDLKFSIDAGNGTDFQVGDVVEIYYDPTEPTRIATDLTSLQSRKLIIFSSLAILFFGGILICVLAKRRTFLVTEEEYREEKAKAKGSEYKTIAGCKIRVQYLNGLLFGELCGFILAVSMLFFNTILDGQGTKLRSFGEVVSLIFVFATLMSPFWILSLLNRRFFGKIVCVVNESGIVYDGSLIRWDEIGKIEYFIRGASEVDEGCCYAKLRGEKQETVILRAPLMLLRKAKKYKKDLKTRLSKKSIFLLAAVPICLVVLSLVVLLL